MGRHNQAIGEWRREVALAPIDWVRFFHQVWQDTKSPALLDRVAEDVPEHRLALGGYLVSVAPELVRPRMTRLAKDAPALAQASLRHTVCALTRTDASKAKDALDIATSLAASAASGGLDARVVLCAARASRDLGDLEGRSTGLNWVNAAGFATSRC